jgi:uncharacterized protein (TIRG00374 family)
MEKDITPVINKIEIDDKTNEPSIIEVPISEVVSVSDSAVCDQKCKRKKQNKEDFDHAKQLVMKQVFGLDSEINTDKRKRRLKNLMSISFFTIVLFVLGITFYNDFFSPSAQQNPPKWSEIKETFLLNWYYILCALTALLFCFLSKGFKLSCMCKKMTGRWRIKTCMETGIIGHYYNYVTPLAVGGQPFEIYHLSRHGVSGGVAAGLPIIAFFMYQLAFVVIGAISLRFFTVSNNVLSIPDSMINSTMANIARPAALIGLISCILMPMIVITFCVLPRACAKLVYFVIGLGAKMKLVKNPNLTTYKTLKTVIGNSKCIKQVGKNPLMFLLIFAISIIEVLSLCSIAYFVLRFFGFDNPLAKNVHEWSQIIVVCMVLYSAVSFIPTPGNSGAADVSFYSLFKVGLVSVAGLSFPAMLTWRLLSYYSFIIIGITFTTFKRRADRKKEQLGIPLYKD